MSEFLAYLAPRLGLILVMVAMDVLFGAIRALQVGEFDLEALAAAYRTKIIPYTLGWLVLAASGFVISTYLTLPPELNLPPEIVDLLTDGMTWVGLGVVILALGRSILDNIQKIWEGAELP